MKKDTERADEIRALKRAWENAEEGRAVKVGHGEQLAVILDWDTLSIVTDCNENILYTGLFFTF